MKLTVSLTEQLAAFVNAKVSEGRYASASDVVQAALSLMQQQEVARLEGLHKAFLNGLADAEAGPAMPLEPAFGEIRTNMKRRVVKLEDFTPEEMALIAATEPATESDT